MTQKAICTTCGADRKPIGPTRASKIRQLQRLARKRTRLEQELTEVMLEIERIEEALAETKNSG